jgi:nucleoside-diphosphate kinase
MDQQPPLTLSQQLHGQQPHYNPKIIQVKPSTSSRKNRKVRKMVHGCNRKERTFIAVKPDGVQRHLVGCIIARFEKRGLKLIGMKLLAPSVDLAERHYQDLKDKPFYNGLVAFISSGPMVALAFEGANAVAIGRAIIGETDPQKALPGTIRGDFCLDIGRNVCHGSDSVDAAEKEIALWFRSEEIMQWNCIVDNNLYEH